MTQADSLDLGFPDTYREIRALTATGMDEEQASAIVYASVRAANAAAIAEAARQSAANDLKFQEVLHAIERVEKDVENVKQMDLKFQQVLSAIERVEKDVESVKKNVEDGVGIEKRREEDSGRFLGSASLIFSALVTISNAVPSAV